MGYGLWDSPSAFLKTTRVRVSPPTTTLVDHRAHHSMRSIECYPSVLVARRSGACSAQTRCISHCQIFFWLICLHIDQTGQKHRSLTVPHLGPPWPTLMYVKVATLGQNCAVFEWIVHQYGCHVTATNSSISRTKCPESGPLARKQRHRANRANAISRSSSATLCLTSTKTSSRQFNDHASCATKHSALMMTRITLRDSKRVGPQTLRIARAHANVPLSGQCGR